MRLSVALAISAVYSLPLLAHESFVDHVQREVQLWTQNGQLFLSYRVEITERQAFMQLHGMDTDRDGTVAEAERSRFFDEFANALCKILKLKLAGKGIAFMPAAKVNLEPGFRQTYVFVAPLEGLAAGRHAGELADGYSGRYPGTYRYRPRLGESRVQVHELSGKESLGQHAGGVVLKFELDLRPAGSKATQD